MSGSTRNVKGFLSDFLTTILSRIDREPKLEGLIDLNRLISGNTASVASNLRGGQHRHLAIKMTTEEYKEHTGFASVLPHNPCNNPQSMGSAIEQALGTEKF